jgi:uncharacterized radical SAM superfamily protein
MLNSKDILELELMLHNGFMKWKEDLRHADRIFSDEESIKAVLKLEGSQLMDMYLNEIEQLSSKKNYA